MKPQKRFRLIYTVPFESIIRAENAEHAKRIFEQAARDMSCDRAPGEATVRASDNVLISCEELPEDTQ